MGVTGRKQTADSERLNKNPHVHDWTDVEDVPFLDRPDMPRRTWRDSKDPLDEPHDIEWPSQTLTWWETVSTMPHCRLWETSDWQFATDTLIVHAAFVENPTGALASELRAREKVMGTTMDARRDLRIRYVKAKAEPTVAAEPTGLVDNVIDFRTYSDLYS